jgi:hypothetical protein
MTPVLGKGRRAFPAGLYLALACASPPAFEGEQWTLVYRSREPIEDALAMQISALCAAWARVRRPWKEGFRFHASMGAPGDGKPKYLSGSVKLALTEYEPEVGRFRIVDASENAVVAYADARWALGQLEAWARLYGMAWEVEFGRVRGRVGPGGLDAGAARILASLYDRAGKPDQRRVEILRAAVDRKYSDRR